MADAGSSTWGDIISTQWSNFSASWSQDYIDSFFDDLSAVWERCCSATPWQSLPIPSIARTGMLYKKMGWSRWLKPTNAARRFGYFATYCWAEGSKRHHVGNKHSTIVLKMASVMRFHRRPSSGLQRELVSHIKRTQVNPFELAARLRS
ncbi:hypothetical protein F444_03017 [Phytophthora nicotianae P1976]|uniref:Uncharacterized protein n=1 Tax=Phytophthora nicotianae P1976 TaxID=1317066 RepID=A0A081AVI3_PHYNI|nr:hypothetical protein F444_03017 [Phytophthora nicotianae P1976]